MVSLEVRPVAPVSEYPDLNEAISEHKTIMIKWIVIKQPDKDSRTGESWKSVSHFSTLPNGWIPDHGVDFFKQFLDELQEMWLRNCAEAEKILAASVRA